jgi:hypothetical protein
MSFRPSKAQPAGQMLSPPLSAPRGPLQIEGQSSTPIDRLARIAAKYGPEITLRDLLDRFSYDCLWRTQSRTKRGHTDCGVYLPDLEHKRPPDLPAGMVKLRLVKKG